MTLLCIDSYHGVSDFLPEMWPHYERAGCDIVGSNRSNAPTRWPRDIPTITYGEDVFKRWCEHKSPTLLNDRMLGTMETLLADERFKKYSDFCLTAWSIVFCKPLPQPMPAPLVLYKTGGPQYERGFKCPYFFHAPWWFNRETGETIARVGRELMARGENEQGSNDLLFGLAVSTAGLTWHNVPAYSMNRLDSAQYIEGAREAMKNGAWWVGNVKDHEQLEKLMR